MFPQCSVILIVLAIENVFGFNKKKKQQQETNLFVRLRSIALQAKNNLSINTVA